MSIRRPEGMSVAQWMLDGVNFKTIILIVVGVVASHYAMGTRVTVIEQKGPEIDRRFDEVTKRLDAQRDQIKDKVDKDSYEADQRRLAEELQSIQASLSNIESVLMSAPPARSRLPGGVKMEALSEQRLALVHPALAAKVRAAADVLAAKGTYFRVAQGLRTYAEQDALYAQGRTAPGHIVTNARGGWSNHNFGCAVDCFPFLSGQTGDLNWVPRSPQFLAMIDAMKQQGLVAGVDWVSIPDAPHFQLASVPVTPTDADRAAFASGGLQAVWAQYE